jgi:hypothetical protein
MPVTINATAVQVTIVMAPNTGLNITSKAKYGEQAGGDQPDWMPQL